MLLRLYRGMMRLGGPVVERLLQSRARKGKEDPGRIDERRGRASLPRPLGRLIWCHAASVGESLSMLPLIQRLEGSAAILLTTGTVSSAELMARRLPAGVIHQYVPLDRTVWVRAFYDHWRPDLVLWAESELWPNLTAEFRRRGLPAALVNGRMSADSFARWRRAPALARSLLGGFDLVLAQTGKDAERFAALGAKRVERVGNLKFSAAPPLDVPDQRAAFEQALAGRMAWLFASTHPGEEAIAADVHARLRQSHPDLLTVIVPRHPGRGGEIAAMLSQRGFAVSRRSDGVLPLPADDIYVADTLGELGLFYRALRVTAIGGSLVPHGGHNPIEAAQLGSAIIYGPHMRNFAEIAAALEQAGAARPASGAEALADTVLELLTHEEARTRLAAAARELANREAAAIDAVMATLAPLFVRADIPV